MDTNYQASTAPVGQVKTNRSLLKVILLTIVTLGIYNLVFFSSISNDINVMASRYDGKKTMHYCLLFFLVGPFTLGIGYWVWYHKMSNRIGSELDRRGIEYNFDFPLQLSLDWRPGLYLVPGDLHLGWDGVALSARWRF